ncbi:MAG: hypothetical protein R3C26_26455 [Calditrichia bacterium]
MEDWASMGLELFIHGMGAQSWRSGTNAQLSVNIHLRWFFKHGTLDRETRPGR